MKIKRKKHVTKRLADINLVLALLLFFGLSLGLVAQKGASAPGVPQQNMKIDEFFDYISPFLQSQGVGRIAKAIHTFADDKIELVLQKLITTTQSLSRNDKLLLLLALADLYKDNRAKQNHIFSLIQRYSDVFKPGEPLLYVLARSGKQQDVSHLLRWLSGLQLSSAEPFIVRAVEAALVYAVQQNDSKAFQQMVAQDVPIDSLLATTLLWEVVEGNKHPGFVDMLVSFGASIDAARGSYTLLMRALMHKNMSIVDRLLRAGADPNLMIDRAVGPPLQLLLSEALRAKKEDRGSDLPIYNRLEQLLRDHGARE